MGSRYRTAKGNYGKITGVLNTGLGTKMVRDQDETISTVTNGLVANLAAPGTKSSGAVVTFDDDLCLTRRALLFGTLVGGLQLAISATMARASAINPSETQVTLPDAIKWNTWSGAPPHAGETATLYGGLDKPGLYLVFSSSDPSRPRRQFPPRRRNTPAGTSVATFHPSRRARPWDFS